MSDVTAPKTDVRLVTSANPYSLPRIVGLIEGLRQGKVLSIRPRSVIIPVAATDGAPVVSLYADDPKFTVSHYSSESVMQMCCGNGEIAESPRVTIVG